MQQNCVVILKPSSLAWHFRTEPTCAQFELNCADAKSLCQYYSYMFDEQSNVSTEVNCDVLFELLSKKARECISFLQQQDSANLKQLIRELENFLKIIDLATTPEMQKLLLEINSSELPEPVTA